MVSCRWSSTVSTAISSFVFSFRKRANSWPERTTFVFFDMCFSKYGLTMFSWIISRRWYLPNLSIHRQPLQYRNEVTKCIKMSWSIVASWHCPALRRSEAIQQVLQPLLGPWAIQMVCSISADNTLWSYAAEELEAQGGTKAWQGAWYENIMMLMLVIQMLPNCRQWRHADGVPQGGWKGGSYISMKLYAAGDSSPAIPC